MFEVFRLCSTQWRLSPVGKRVALDYTSVYTTLKFCGIEPDKTFLEKIKCLEAGALAATYEQRLESVIYG